MSDPIRVQKRLHGPGTLRLAPPRHPDVRQASRAHPGRAAVANDPDPRSHASSVPAHRSAVTSAAFDALLQRTETTGPARREPRVFVCAAATGREPVGAVIETLVDHAVGLGMTVRRARLTDTLLGEAAVASGAGARPEPMPEMADVLRSAAADVAFLEADQRRLVPEVTHLLRAGATVAVMLVAETGRTRRDALQAAAQRVRAAGCNQLGVVLYARTPYWPAWARWLFDKLLRARR